MRPIRQIDIILRSFFSFAVLGFSCCSTQANPASSDWPRWRGPEFNGITSDSDWFSSNGTIKTLWTVPVGQGYSGVAVVGTRLFTIGNQKGMDIVHCLDIEAGKTIWSSSYPCAPGGSYSGPRSTPTVDENRLYTFSREGHLNCWNTENGKLFWAINIQKELNCQPPGWGFSGSPLVAGNSVFVNAGKNGVAVDKRTGNVFWRSDKGAPGYATPVLLTPHGKEIIALFSSRSFFGVDPKTGNILWDYPWKTSYDVNAADPVVDGSKVFISSGYGHGGALLNIDNNHRLSLVWENKQLKSHFSSPVLFQGSLFGIDGNTGGGEIKCLDIATGKALWSNGTLGFGSLIIADGKLVILSEKGVLAIAEASSKGYKELARSKILDSTCWTAPVVAAGRIFCRNDKGTLVCLSVASQ